MESLWSVYYPKKYAHPVTDTGETLYMRMRRISARFPNRIAIEYGSKRITYSAFMEKIEEVAGIWKKLGVVKGDTVLLTMGNNPLNIVSVYALDKLGAVAALAVPNLATEHFVEYANAVGAAYCVMSKNQYWNYKSVLKDTKITTLVLGEYRSMITGLNRLSIYYYELSAYDLPEPKEFPEGIRVLGWREFFAFAGDEQEAADLECDTDNMHPAICLFPSEASAGFKVLKLSSKSINLSMNLTEMVYMADEDLTGIPARMLCLNECCFAFGLVCGVLSVLSCAQTALLYTWYDSEKILYAISQFKPDVIIGYNSTIASINKAGSRSDVLRSVNRIIVGGGLLTSAQKALLFEIAQNSHRKMSVCSITGCDELMTYAYAPSDLESDRLLGFPVPGVIMRVADSETGLDVPEGAEGEIAVCSPVALTLPLSGNMKNYKKMPDGRIWFFTGKIGKQDANKMFYLVGSKAREARIGSFPIFLDMVDEAVQMTEGVVESSSVMIEKPEGPVLISAVVPSERYFYDNSLIEDLRNRIKSECEMMLHEAMRPSEITFFVSLPKTSMGRIDYEAVKEKVNLILDESNSGELQSEKMYPSKH